MVTRLDGGTMRPGSAKSRAPQPVTFIGVVVKGFRLLLKAVLPIAVLAAALYGARYLKSTKPAPPQRVAAENRTPVRTTVANAQSVRPTLRIYGSAVAGREVELRALVSGRVVETGEGLRDGAVVESEALLVKIDPFDYQSAIRATEASLAEAKAKLDEYHAALAIEQSNVAFSREQSELAVEDLKRAEALVGRGNLPERTLDDRRLIVSQRRQAIQRDESTIKIQEARIAQQRAMIDRLDNELERNRRRLAETRLTAPFEAYVADVDAHVGRMLSVNDRVVTLIDRERIDVAFTLTDRQYGRLVSGGQGLEGRQAEVLWEIGDEPRRYVATVERIAARVSAESGGVEVFARVENPADGVPLRPGAFVRVVLSDVTYDDVTKLPSKAVYDGATVYIVENSRLVPRNVEVVGVDGGDVLVRGEVGNGERVVVTRLAAPGPGVAVEELGDGPR